MDFFHQVINFSLILAFVAQHNVVHSKTTLQHSFWFNYTATSSLNHSLYSFNQFSYQFIKVLGSIFRRHQSAKAFRNTKMLHYVNYLTKYLFWNYRFHFLHFSRCLVLSYQYHIFNCHKFIASTVRTEQSQ